jgi:hypothetical protein
VLGAQALFPECGFVDGLLVAAVSGVALPPRATGAGLQP